MKQFKFFNHIASHPRFLEVVDRVWNETAPLYHSLSDLQIFQDKLKGLKFEMCGLNRDILSDIDSVVTDFDPNNMFGDLPGRVKQAYDDLCVKHTEVMQNPQKSTFEEFSDAWEHWHHTLSIEEQFYYQMSRVQWLGLGDRNSQFFYKVTHSRKCEKHYQAYCN
ncbi:hypothetical protein F2Q70_00020395 [Brassica cretica]|uniref:Uncharacterized protein n=1 Tax=Brassica cretica TaxID=69181 RepID=A0A8S9GUW8_BRACR|nr:hypothetical protein F2Q70_00020395 [Brassica cretica]